MNAFAAAEASLVWAMLISISTVLSAGRTSSISFSPFLIAVVASYS